MAIYIVIDTCSHLASLLNGCQYICSARKMEINTSHYVHLSVDDYGINARSSSPSHPN